MIENHDIECDCLECIPWGALPGEDIEILDAKADLDRQAVEAAGEFASPPQNSEAA